MRLFQIPFLRRSRVTEFKMVVASRVPSDTEIWRRSNEFAVFCKIACDYWESTYIEVAMSGMFKISIIFLYDNDGRLTNMEWPRGLRAMWMACSCCPWILKNVLYARHRQWSVMRTWCTSKTFDCDRNVMYSKVSSLRCPPAGRK